MKEGYLLLIIPGVISLPLVVYLFSEGRWLKTKKDEQDFQNFVFFLTAFTFTASILLRGAGFLTLSQLVFYIYMFISIFWLRAFGWFAASWFAAYIRKQREEEDQLREERRQETLAEQKRQTEIEKEAARPAEYKQGFIDGLKFFPDGPIKDALVKEFTAAISEHPASRFEIGSVVHPLMDDLVNAPPLRFSESGGPITFYFNAKRIPFRPFVERLEKVLVEPCLDPKYRIQHTHIMAKTGHGKSTLLKMLIANDLATDAGIVVLDSQGSLVEEIAPHVKPDRLVVIDPQHCPVGLNMFGDGKATNIEKVIDLYSYAFGALELQLSGKMSVLFRFLCALVARVPGGNVMTMYDILKNGAGEYHQYVEALDPITKGFFRTDFDAKLYKDTREDIVGRLYGILSNPALTEMLSSADEPFDIGEAVNRGKVVLINTNKPYLGDKNAALLGRIVLVSFVQAVLSRSREQRHRTYLYIDEFGDYAQEGQFMSDLFEQTRKFELGVHVAHQNLKQLKSTSVEAAVHGTAMKLTGKLNAEDAATMARQMRTEQSDIDHVPEHMFRYYSSGSRGVAYWKVNAAALDAFPRYEDISSIRQRMRNRTKAAIPAAVPEKAAAPQQPRPGISDAEMQRRLDYLRATRKPTQYDEEGDEWPD